MASIFQTVHFPALDTDPEEQRLLSKVSLHPVDLQRQDQDGQADHRRRRRLPRLLSALRLRPALHRVQYADLKHA